MSCLFVNWRLNLGIEHVALLFKLTALVAAPLAGSRLRLALLLSGACWSCHGDTKRERVWVDAEDHSDNNHNYYHCDRGALEPLVGRL